MDLITTTQAAKMRGYHPDHINRLIRDGKIKAQKIGNIWAVDKESLMNYQPDTLTRFKKGERSRNSLYTSKSTIIVDRPIISKKEVAKNQKAIELIQQQAKTALYVDVYGNVISEVKRK